MRLSRRIRAPRRPSMRTACAPAAASRSRSRRVPIGRAWELFQELVAEYRSDQQLRHPHPGEWRQGQLLPDARGRERAGLKVAARHLPRQQLLPEGEYNLYRMREVFDCDHIIVRPSVDVLDQDEPHRVQTAGRHELARALRHFHGPIQVAVRYKVPLMLWGEHGFMDLGGMYSLNDFRRVHRQVPSRTRLTRLRLVRLHRRRPRPAGAARADGRPERKDLLWAQYPSDDEIADAGVRGIYLGNFVNWEANYHSQIVIEKVRLAPGAAALRAHLPHDVQPR